MELNRSGRSATAPLQHIDRLGSDPQGEGTRVTPREGGQVMDDDERREYIERQGDPTRVLALSDGVFAIILTLLVLEIRVPELGSDDGLGDALREIRPSFIAFLISFVVVDNAWARHRDLFALIRRTDRPVIWLNILYMLPLAILPFGTELLARYNRDAVALEIYGLILVAIQLTRLAIWGYVTGHPDLLYAPVPERSRWNRAAVVTIPTVAYVVAIAIADRYPTLSLAIYALTPVIYFVAISIARKGADSGSAEQNLT
jgi:uncharacterized membrane protein